jgi:hypothetical protein
LGMAISPNNPPNKTFSEKTINFRNIHACFCFSRFLRG